MSHGPYGTWSPQGVKSEATQGSQQFSNAPEASSSSRRAGPGGAQQYGYTEGYPQTGSYRRFTERGNVRPPSTSPTSSLSGAMGDAHISSQYQSSSSMAWAPSSHAMGDYVMIPDQEGNMQPYLASPPTSVPSASPSGAFALSQQYSTYSNIPSGTMSSPAGVPSPVYAEPFAYQQSQARSVMQASPNMSSMTPSPVDVPMSAATVPISRSSRSAQEKRLEDEVRRLQQKVHELELINESARQRMKELEREASRGGYRAGGSSSAASALPSPVQTPTLPPGMQENWRARTDARTKIFCSLNRAGNALCAWHDSRRERRAFPPRMAPPGHLNCGCTFDEALFEESLARHGVGSYHPGENVRMDPALRNPLLRLLQQRYGYQDGDFERDPATGRWVDGEGAAHWEAKLAAGAASTKKTRGDERR
ncbi:hypothetical protein BKA93DRAFT_816616 [Sparassis latifolia]|uniref:Uncharacterized protein n=1 Tax=Sparassis crispa TaxID=139825 RepID=A0A401GZE3_9APHY|nr:hypothetical protein SCP_1102100 [Sparassis crispa]GBE87533.1 hypothetical protein SCP_1102100 [Sparassis crispa]